MTALVAVFTGVGWEDQRTTAGKPMRASFLILRSPPDDEVVACCTSCTSRWSRKWPPHEERRYVRGFSLFSGTRCAKPKLSAHGDVLAAIRMRHPAKPTSR